MRKNRKLIKIIMIIIILILSVSVYFIWKNTTFIKFKGKEEILNETLVTLKEGEFIQSTEIENKEGDKHYKYSVGHTEIAELFSYDSVLKGGELSLIEENGTLSRREYRKKKDDSYIYNFNLEKNIFERKLKIKGYEVTAFETHNDDYYLAYVQTDKYKREPYIDEDGNDNERLIMDKFSSEISNPTKQKSIILENRYVYFLVYENSKLYAFLGKDYSKKGKFDFSDILLEKPIDVYIYNDKLEKVGEVKNNKEKFIKEKTFNLGKFNFSPKITMIEKDSYKIEYKDSTYDQRKSGYYTEISQYKDDKLIKSILIKPVIYKFYLTSPISYQPEGYLILKSDTPSGFIKLNVETLEYEDYSIKGLEPDDD